MDAKLVPVRPPYAPVVLLLRTLPWKRGRKLMLCLQYARRMMIFVPILLLQITIFFWSYRIGRIVFKLIKGTSATE